MKLKTISLAAIAAIAALAGPAFAQSQVAAYGNLDAGLLAISNTSGGIGYIPSPVNKGSDRMVKDGGLGASNWGFKGVEDLGGGLRALFQMQGNLALDTGVVGGPNSGGTTSMWNQTAAIGLASSWGTVRFGRQVSPTYWAMAATDARGGRYFGSSLTALVGLNSASGVFIGDNSNVAFGTVYNDNAITYTSPVFYSTTVNLLYALGEVSGNHKGNVQQAATAVYDDGHLKLSALFYNGYGNNLPAATALYTRQLGNAAAANAAIAATGMSQTTNTNRLMSAGALYTWDGGYTVSASYMAARNPSEIRLVPNGSISLDLWSVGAGWRMSSLTALSAGYYDIKDNTNSGNSAWQFALGLDYYLSKRTIAYAEAASTGNHGANMNLSPVYATPVAANDSVHALMVGLRHSF